MAVPQKKIVWDEEVEQPVAASAQPAGPSPALMLQQLLEQHRAVLTGNRPLDRDQVRRLIMTSSVAASALWLALIGFADATVKLVA